MLRIGLLSDLHADAQAVERALDLLCELGVDKVLCLGDLVEKGDDGDQVVSLIERSWVSCIKGNHDENAVLHSEMPEELLPPGYVDKKLLPATLSFLDELPLYRWYQWEGLRVFLCHATPSSLRASLFHSAVPHTFAKRFKKDLLRVGADIVLLGHTHIPMEAVFRGIHVYNPGSVCRRKTRDSHTCAVLSLPDKSFEVYDIGTGERVYDILRISC